MTKKLMLKQLASMLASFKRKKKYYCEVEYIENTETGSTRNWINTGIFVDPTATKWEVRVAFNDTGTGKLMGSGYAGNTRFNLGIEGNKFRFGFATTWFDANASILTPDTNPHTWSLDATTKTGTIDGYSATSTAEFGVDRYPIALFGRANGATSVETSNTTVGKIYYTKIWQNNVLVRDMIPVLDWNYVPCMYDKVSDELFYNQGTGNFSYGREIHYVDYLESTEGASQWIDTGYIIDTATDEIELDYQFLSDTVYKWIFGDHYGTKRLAIGSGDGETKRNLAYNTTTYKIADKYLFNNTHRYNINSTGAYIDGDKLVNYSSFTGSANLYLFTINIDSSAVYTSNGRIWKYSHKRNGEYIRDMYPAIDENGVGYMFDKVTHSIFNNAGTDAFKYPLVQTEYLETTAVGGCIDLGLKYKSSMSIECKYTRTEQGDSGSVLPLSNNTTAPLIYLPALDAGSMKDRFVWRRGGYNEQRADKEFSGYPVTTEFKVDAINDILYIDDAVALTGMIAAMNGYESPYESNSNLFMLSINGIYGGLGKIYYLKLYDTTQVYRDLIPAWKDGQFGMYDKENNVLYQNIKTDGTIVSGKIIESEYLE